MSRPCMALVLGDREYCLVRIHDTRYRALVFYGVVAATLIA